MLNAKKRLMVVAAVPLVALKVYASVRHSVTLDGIAYLLFLSWMIVAFSRLGERRLQVRVHV